MARAPPRSHCWCSTSAWARARTPRSTAARSARPQRPWPSRSCEMMWGRRGKCPMKRRSCRMSRTGSHPRKERPSKARGTRPSRRRYSGRAHRAREPPQQQPPTRSLPSRCSSERRSSWPSSPTGGVHHVQRVVVTRPSQGGLRLHLTEWNVRAGERACRALLKCHAIQKLPPDHPGLLTEKGGKGTAPRWCMALDLCTVSACHECRRSSLGARLGHTESATPWHSEACVLGREPTRGTCPVHWWAHVRTPRAARGRRAAPCAAWWRSRCSRAAAAATRCGTCSPGCMTSPRPWRECWNHCGTAGWAQTPLAVAPACSAQEEAQAHSSAERALRRDAPPPPGAQ